MDILTVFKTEITIGNVTIDAYTANEVSSTTGKFINYLSGAGLAESIGLHRNTTLQNRMSKELKDLLGNNSTTLHPNLRAETKSEKEHIAFERQGKYKNSQNSWSKVNLWDTTSAAKYYRYHDKQGNELASRIVTALVSTTLDIIIDDRFGRVYKSGEAEARTKARLAGKVVRRSLTDAIKGWLDTTDHPLDHATIYAQCTNQIYMALWGVTAADIRKHFNLKPGNIPPTRDYLSEHVLRVIERAEDRVIEAIDYDNAIPHENAVEIARLRPARISFKN